MTIESLKFTYDNALLLHDGLAAITADGGGVVGGSAKILDLGPGVVHGFLILDVSAVDVVTGDEKYNVHFQMSSSASFASGIRQMVMRELGDDTQILADADAGAGRYIVPFINVAEDGTVYRYVRVYVDVSGTTPSITFKAWLAKK